MIFSHNIVRSVSCGIWVGLQVNMLFVYPCILMYRFHRCVYNIITSQKDSLISVSASALFCSIHDRIYIQIIYLACSICKCLKKLHCIIIESLKHCLTVYLFTPSDLSCSLLLFENTLDCACMHLLLFPFLVIRE
jgi:hypothetical protein